MPRTQIYLQDTVYEQLKHKSQMIGVNISELIRRYSVQSQSYFVDF